MKRPNRRQFLYLAALGGAVALAALGVLATAQLYNWARASQLQVLRLQAESAAKEIGQFFGEIESQIGWTTQLPMTARTIEALRFDGLRLLRQMPFIIVLTQLDATGMEQLCVSRFSKTCDVSSVDFSKDPKFTEAVAKKVYHGPVYFRRESEPYMTLSLAGARPDAGVSVAEVNLKFIWDVASQIKDGSHAYIVDAQGRLIAHPDISLVLRNTDMRQVPPVRAARAAGAGEAWEFAQANIEGRKVLTTYAPVAKLGWLVFVERPFW